VLIEREVSGGGRRPGAWEGALSGPCADASLAYKRVPFLLPTMRLLNSMFVNPELPD